MCTTEKESILYFYEYYFYYFRHQSPKLRLAETLVFQVFYLIQMKTVSSKAFFSSIKSCRAIFIIDKEMLAKDILLTLVCRQS